VPPAVEPVVAVKTLLLQAQFPDLPLRAGASIVARVMSRGASHGVLVIAGVPLSAQMPKEIGRTGETLRLKVTEVTPERVTLQLDQVLVPAGQPAPTPAERPRVTVQDPPRTVRVDGEERATVALSFQSTALGRLDLRLEVGGTRVHARVEAAAGRSYELADAAAERLQAGLHARTGLEADVRVTPRHEPLDLYA
jgi:hypothetical protein